MNRQVKQPKDAAAPVRARHAAIIAELPFSDRTDFADAARGFLGTRENAHIVNDKGRVVWSLQPYGFLADSEAPHTVNPSLWRQSQLNMHNGLFEVVPGVYQVRGFDIGEHDADRGRQGRDRRRLPLLDRRRAGGDRALRPASRRAPCHRRHHHAYAQRPLGRRARRRHRCGDRQRKSPDHRARPVHGERRLGERHRRARHAPARALSVRAFSRQGRARTCRLRPRQDHLARARYPWCGRTT